ncbi:hypothetical protein AAG906_037666 [Vitis piasezkii]
MEISRVNRVTRPPLLGRVWESFVKPESVSGLVWHVQRPLRDEGGGQVDATAANNANTSLYTTFAIFGVLGGDIYNILDPCFTLFAGCSTYVLYADSFLYYNHYQHQGFTIVVHLQYGGVIGGLIPFILNYNRSEAAFVNDDTYIGFMCFMSAGIILTLAILHSSYVVRDDDNHCTNIKYSDVSTKAVEILKLFRNWKMLLMVPTNPAPSQVWDKDGKEIYIIGTRMG